MFVRTTVDACFYFIFKFGYRYGTADCRGELTSRARYGRYVDTARYLHSFAVSRIRDSRIACRTSRDRIVRKMSIDAVIDIVDRYRPRDADRRT